MERLFRHKLVSLYLLIASLILLLIRSFFQPNIPEELSNFLADVATALLSIALIEFIFKTYLQKDLIEDVIKTFKDTLKLPVEAVYLQRKDLPEDQSPINIIASVNKELYIKAISYIGFLDNEEFFIDLRKILEKKKNISIHFLILSPDFGSMDEVAALTGSQKEIHQAASKSFVKNLEILQKDFPQIDYAYYKSFPTMGCWIIDPESDGLCRVETYLVYGENSTSRTNLILSKKHAPEFFEELYKAIRLEYKKGKDDLEKAKNMQSTLQSKPNIFDLKKGKRSQTKFNMKKSSENNLLCLTFSSTNLNTILNYYQKNDLLLDKNIRGSNTVPPLSSTGLLRIIDPEDQKNKLDLPLPRPMGVCYDYQNNRFFVVNQKDNCISELSPKGIASFITHPLFNHLHSIDYFNGLISIASSGTDSIIVFDVKEKKEIFSWLATENGYDTCPDGKKRKVDRNIDYKSYIFPTLQQVTHINSVAFSRNEPGILYASLFHQGEIIRIDTNTKTTSVILKNLDHPHGLKTTSNGGYILSLSSQGKIMVFDSYFNECASVSDKGVAWLQDSCEYAPDKLIFSDADKSNLKIYDLNKKEVIGNIAYENNLKIYQSICINDISIDQIKWLENIQS